MHLQSRANFNKMEKCMTEVLATSVYQWSIGDFRWFSAELSALKYTTGWSKKLAPFLYAFTLPNINRFSQLFHSQNEEKIYNNTITKDPTTPQVCRYTTLWNVFMKILQEMYPFTR